MESLAPPLMLIVAVRTSIESGSSVKVGVEAFLQKNESEFVGKVTLWLATLRQGKDTQPILSGIHSIHRKTLLLLLERGLRGESIHQALLVLEKETVEACKEEIAQKIAQLPIILLIPLLLFQFPAFLLLLFGPLVQNFFHSFGG